MESAPPRGDEAGPSADSVRSEQAEIESVLAAILDSSGDAIVCHTMTGVVTSWNPAAERLHGYTAAETVGRPISALIPSDRPDELSSLLLRVTRGDRIAQFETVRLHKAGTRLDVSLSVTPVKAADGRIVGAATIARAIGDRQSAEEDRAARAHGEAARAEAERSQRRFALLVEASELLASSLDYETTLRHVARLAVPIFADFCTIDMVEPDGTIERVAMYHVDPEREELLREIRRRWPPHPTATQPQYQALRSGKPLILPTLTDEMIQEFHPTPDHYAAALRLDPRSGMCLPLISQGATLGVITFGRGGTSPAYQPEELALGEEIARRAATAIDNALLYRRAQEEIAARERAEAERAQLLAREEVARTKDELLSVVSHELRTPLAALVGFTELLLVRDYAEEQRRHFLPVMLEEGRRLTGLINDFLDLQRIQSGTDRIQPHATAIAPLLARAVAAAGDDPTCPIALDVPADLPPILADEDRLLQVVGNLLSNVRKYSPQGGLVRITARAVQGAVEVTVQDQGLGIPPEALPRMFEKFYRVDSSDRRQIKGTGLGLAIVKNLILAHGGEIVAESAGEGKGSTFRFTLPSAGTPAAAHAAPPALTSDTDNRDVLVVEDDPAFASWLAETLRAQGYEVRVVTSAVEALDVIGHGRPRVVLLDLRLQGQLDGWDLLAVLRGRLGLADLPVVVVSAYDERDRGQALGVSDYFLKPVIVERLLAAVRRSGVGPGRRILVVEDEPAMRQLVVATLHEARMHAHAVGSGEEALEALDAEPGSYGLMLLDLGLPGMDGLAVLDAVRARPETRDLPVVVVTARELDAGQKLRLTEQAARVLRKGNGVPVVDAVRRALQAAADDARQAETPPFARGMSQM